MALGTSTRPASDPSLAEEEDLFDLANLFPRTTGLTVVAWVSQRANARHAARVEVCRGGDGRMDVNDTAVVGIAPSAALIEGPLDPAVLRQVAAWIDLNRTVLLDFWNESIDTAELIAGLRKV